jgi:stearoyl-CoA desaturase (delta-9 desaturase)
LGWLRGRGFGYPAEAVRDLTRRADLTWIDRHWYLWYVSGLFVPAAAGYAIGGTAYDALISFLWGGLFRHFLTTQATFCVNSVNHLWGTRPYVTADHSRNNLVTGILAFGEGWHNNHHAFPWSARHGLRWWQPDLSWWVLWALERAGLVWRVRRAVPGPGSEAPGGPRTGDCGRASVDRARPENPAYTACSIPASGNHQ